ncbi:serine hydrolase domain-containing protein [Streptomyces sp. CBMA123]|uniref:serine hydrolase domain-containing protein n=1 Tax=Streptomyces sp. CBMA123 TaxID=1896313 RepID=UPI0016618FA9|nr:serine hydrolase domain-containing protein [Streptomyces sp. CBMA123]MBD0695391.1 serine hydrolase [Streptomyces sp. CBMA123]
MTKTRRPRPAASRTAGRATAAALALTGLLAVSACSGGSSSSQPAGGAAVTAEPAALSPSATLSGGASGVTSASASVVPLTPDVQSRLDVAIKQVMSQASIPGVIVGYTTPDGSYQRTFGVADKNAGTPMSPDMYMRIGSVTKTFTTTGILQLVEQGKVGLDDPISKYIPNVPGGDGITIRELGDMRSGLYNYTLDPDFQQAFFSNPDRVFTPDQLLAYSFKHPANFAPDAKFEYSNTNLILLGQVVEKVGGQPLPDFLNQQVFTPAGLTKTTLPTDATFPDPHAHGYTNQTATGAVEDATDWNPSWGWAAGAAISTLSDLQTWSKVLATGAPLLSPATQAERLKTKSVGSPDLGYGFGVFTTHGWVGHNGSLPGYESVVIYLPDAQASLVILLNTDITYQGSEPSTLLARAITQIVSPNNVYTLPTPPGSASPSAPGSASASASGSPATPSGTPSLHIS